MSQRADNPHQAAVHLMKALRCCRTCESVSQADYMQLSDLEQEKQELSDIGNPDAQLERLGGEIHDLQYLIEKVKEENEIAYQCGLKQIDELMKDREMYEREHNQNYQYQYAVEKEKLKNITIQIEKQIQHIQYLHRINQEEVNKFCEY